MTTATIFASIDSYMNATYPDTNYGTSYITVSNIWIGGDKLEGARAIGMFDLSGIPAGATIDSAKLVQNIYAVDVGNRPATLYRIVRNDWVELEVTWNNYKSGTPWTTIGASDDPDDYTATDKVTFTFPASTGAFDITGMKTLVEDAIANRSDKLHVKIEFDEETQASGSDFYRWRSHEYGTASLRWKLVVEYTAAAVTSRRRALAQTI